MCSALAAAVESLCWDGSRPQQRRSFPAGSCTAVNHATKSISSQCRQSHCQAVVEFLISGGVQKPQRCGAGAVLQWQRLSSSGGGVSSEGAAGLGDLKDLFQPWQFCGSVILRNGKAPYKARQCPPKPCKLAVPGAVEGEAASPAHWAPTALSSLGSWPGSTTPSAAPRCSRGSSKRPGRLNKYVPIHRIQKLPCSTHLLVGVVHLGSSSSYLCLLSSGMKSLQESSSSSYSASSSLQEQKGKGKKKICFVSK